MRYEVQDGGTTRRFYSIICIYPMNVFNGGNQCTEYLLQEQLYNVLIVRDGLIMRTLRLTIYVLSEKQRICICLKGETR